MRGQARRSRIGKVADSNFWPCEVCGTFTKHRYCKTHDPAKAQKQLAHAERVARYKSRLQRGPQL